MSQFPTGSSGSGGGGISDVTGSSISINSGSGSSSSSSSSGGESGSTNGFVWSPRQVVTKLGTVQGFIVRPPNGYEGVEVFLNMPYASPPEGSLRFMPPVSGSPWQGTRRSETPSPVCPQVLPNIRNESEALKVMPRGRLIYLRRLLPHLRNQSEDCLYLNVYVPAGGKPFMLLDDRSPKDQHDYLFTEIVAGVAEE
ncbi:Neuroligin 4-like [Orchesella cincta]|uniref:Neuroligin 4-like n=1 Tax=Orchesella cincta TaxID=48709 RepID=A0A1D2MAU2_ORCCI|nr:Neuroligin 4-like [Orchesella cincta]